MAIELATRYTGYVDELFTTESKLSLLTNNDFDWIGANAIKIYKISTSEMNDYDRIGDADSGNWSRYGNVQGLGATTQRMTIERDRSFTFAIDKLDEDETVSALKAASALARQIREVVIPEVDKWVYAKMCENAGNKPAAIALTKTNIYERILIASEALDTAEAPESNRQLIGGDSFCVRLYEAEQRYRDGNRHRQRYATSRCYCRSGWRECYQGAGQSAA